MQESGNSVILRFRSEEILLFFCNCSHEILRFPRCILLFLVVARHALCSFVFHCFLTVPISSTCLKELLFVSSFLLALLCFRADCSFIRLVVSLASYLRSPCCRSSFDHFFEHEMRKEHAELMHHVNYRCRGPSRPWKE